MPTDNDMLSSLLTTLLLAYRANMRELWDTIAELNRRVRDIERHQQEKGGRPQ